MPLFVSSTEAPMFILGINATSIKHQSAKHLEGKEAFVKTCDQMCLSLRHVLTSLCLMICKVLSMLWISSNLHAQ